MIPLQNIIGLLLRRKDSKNIPPSFSISNLSCPLVFYEIPNTKSKRGTSFGNGSRVSF
jgi:hypothetical protein